MIETVFRRVKDQTTNITYHGWSSFAIECAGRKMLFDPFYRKLFDAQWVSPEDFDDAELICVTHGHYDHYGDTPNIMKWSKAKVVASTAICDHLLSKHKIHSSRLIPIKPFHPVEVNCFKITAFEWGHREISIPSFLAKGLFRSKLIPTLQFAWLNLFKAPFTAPYYGFHIALPNGVNVMNYNEGFNDLMNLEEVQKIGNTLQTDILLAGIQLDWDSCVASGVAAISPKKVILFHPHEQMFKKLGIPSLSESTFIDKVKSRMPMLNVEKAQPNNIYNIPK